MTVPSLYGTLRAGFAFAALVVALAEEVDATVFAAGVLVFVEPLPEVALRFAADFLSFGEVVLPPVPAFMFFAGLALAAAFGVDFGADFDVAAANMLQGSARASASRAATNHRAGDKLRINTAGITRQRAIVKRRCRARYCTAGLFDDERMRMALRFGSLLFRTLNMRPMSAVEIALVVSVAGCVLAASAPTFFREIHASRMSEAIDGLNRIGAGALAYSHGKELAASFPPAAPLTPSEVPRGTSIKDPENTWDTPTWRALDFGFDRAHRYAFKFDVANDPNRIWFQATAHGDLTGDGILSTFQLTGERQAGQDASLLPGIFVHREVE